MDVVRLEFEKKRDSTSSCSQEVHFQLKETDRLKIKDGKKYTR